MFKKKFQIKEDMDETVFMFALLSVGSLIKEEIDNKKSRIYSYSFAA